MCVPWGSVGSAGPKLLALRIPPGVGSVANTPVDVDWRSQANAPVTPKQSTSNQIKFDRVPVRADPDALISWSNLITHTSRGDHAAIAFGHSLHG